MTTPTKTTLAILLSLGPTGCGYCTEAPSRAVVAGCLAPVGSQAPPPTTATIDGTVTAVGADLLDACLDGDAFGSDGQLSASASEDVFVLRIQDAAGAEHLVGGIAPGVAPRVRVGDAVVATYDHHGEKFAPSYAVLEVRVDGELVAWLGLAGQAGELGTPPEVSVTEGAATCTHRNDCLTWSEHEIGVSVGPDAATLLPGDVVSLGDHQVLHGGSERQESSSRCVDAFVGRTALALWSP